MPKVRVAGFSVSLDGFSAGREQTFVDPLGKRGTELFQWFFPTRAFHEMTGQPGGLINADNTFAGKSMNGFGAFIIGRNMFSHSRGTWPDDGWKGWWGANPPFHAPAFILTHHERDPLVMEGGTTFHFVTGGIHAALVAAKDAAGDQDVKIGGGVSVVRQYLKAGLVDSLHLAFVPVFLGQGEAPLSGIDLCSLGFSVTSHTGTEKATHVMLEKNAGAVRPA